MVPNEDWDCIARSFRGLPLHDVRLRPGSLGAEFHRTCFRTWSSLFFSVLLTATGLGFFTSAIDQYISNEGLTIWDLTILIIVAVPITAMGVMFAIAFVLMLRCDLRLEYSNRSFDLQVFRWGKLWARQSTVSDARLVGWMTKLPRGTTEYLIWLEVVNAPCPLAIEVFWGLRHDQWVKQLMSMSEQLQLDIWMGIPKQHDQDGQGMLLLPEGELSYEPYMFAHRLGVRFRMLRTEERKRERRAARRARETGTPPSDV